MAEGWLTEQPKRWSSRWQVIGRGSRSGSPSWPASSGSSSGQRPVHPDREPGRWPASSPSPWPGTCRPGPARARCCTRCSRPTSGRWRPVDAAVRTRWARSSSGTPCRGSRRRTRRWSWGIAFGLDTESRRSSSRSLKAGADPTQDERPDADVWYPPWWTMAQRRRTAHAGTPAGRVSFSSNSAGLFSSSPIPDPGSIMAALGSIARCLSPAQQQRRR